MKVLPLIAIVLAISSHVSSEETMSDSHRNAPDVLSGDYRWECGGPVLSAAQVADEELVAVKDPSIVRYNDRWHLFCTVRGPKLGRELMYFSFDDWSNAGKAKHYLLKLQADHPGAPQVFYFAPHKKWYLICQAYNDAWEPTYGASYSTTTNIADPRSWSPLKPLGAKRVKDDKVPEGKAGLDFWVICDERKAHLFFTTNDGRMWHEETALANFPGGWSEAQLAIKGDIFEASDTYKLKGLDKYLTIIEAQGGHGWRYYKAYVADRLDGEWKPLAAEKDHAFASMQSVRQTGEHWTDSVSHGELIRAGYDQRLEVDPKGLRFVFQGVAEQDVKGKNYVQIPWSLGILELHP